MTNRIEAQTETLTWTVRHNGPGTTRYYESTDKATGTAFTAYQLGKSKWALTGARNGETVLDTADATLKGVKALAEGHLAGLGTQVAPDASEDIPAEAAPATVEVVEDVLAEAAAVKVGDQIRTATETLRGVSAAMTDWARHVVRDISSQARTTARYGCGCPSPVHRMNCGRGARPVVINRKDA